MKNIKKILFCLSLLFLLSGCIKTEIQIQVDASQNIKVNGHFLIDEAILNQYSLTLEQIIDDSPFKGYAFLENSSDLQKQIDDKNYIGKSFMHEFSKESELIKTEIINDELQLSINPEAIESIQFDINALEDRKDNSSFLKELGVEATMVIKMPAKIIWSSIGEVQGNEVVIDLTAYEAEGIVIKSELHDHTPTYLLIGGSVLVMTGFLLFKKFKNKK